AVLTPDCVTLRPEPLRPVVGVQCRGGEGECEEDLHVGGEGGSRAGWGQAFNPMQRVPLARTVWLENREDTTRRSRGIDGSGIFLTQRRRGAEDAEERW